MDTTRFYHSLTHELDALKDRVRNFIADRHWPTDGEWKETVLRSVIRRHLPSTMDVGRGFVIGSYENSSQIDVLVFDTSKPVLYRDGDLVFVTPDAVRALIEVKSVASSGAHRKGLEQLASNAAFLRRNGRDRRASSPFIGLFAYESRIGHQLALNQLQRIAGGDPSRLVDHVCLGPSEFIRFWFTNPEQMHDGAYYGKWHSYRLEDLAPGYFIMNLIEHVARESVGMNKPIWFPLNSKEMRKTAEKPLRKEIEQAPPPAPD